jgi:hypothetical protein
VSPSAGEIWFDTSTGSSYIYYNSAWVELGAGAMSPLPVTSSTRPSAAWEGQTIYETDTNINQQYDGANWGPTYPGSGFRNLIINGGMQVDQRATALTGTNTGYTVDRWRVGNYSGNTQITTSQNSDVPSGQGFTHSLRMTATSVATYTGDVIEVSQAIEGLNSAQLAWGTAGAKTITVSFWVRSAVTGTYSIKLSNFGATRNYVASYTISAVNTWEKKTITIAGDTSGTWLTTNGSGVFLSITPRVETASAGTAGTWSSSSAYGVTGHANAFATVGNIFAITGVQLEANPQPTPFEQRPYGTELALCQRYFCTVADGAFATNLNVGLTHYYQAGFLVARCSFPVSMRSNAITLVATSGTNYYINYSNNNGGDGFNSWTLNVVNFNEALIYNGSEVAGTSGYAGDCRLNNALAKISFSAEL